MEKETIKKAREFCREVRKLGEKYNLSFFFVTEGASVTQNRDSEPVENARNAHKKWEIEHGLDSEHNWEKNIIYEK